jgi:O-antigen ligase
MPVLALIGLLAAEVASPWLTATAIIVVTGAGLALVVIWRYPELGIAFLTFLGSAILDPQVIAIKLPVGGTLQAPDLMLIGLLTLALLKRVIRNENLLPQSRVVIPLLLFMGWALLSALWATLYLGVDISWSFSELRGLAYYLVFLLVAMEVRNRTQLWRLFVGLALVALLTIAVMLAQQFFGRLPLVAGQATTRVWQVIAADGVTRIRPPAHVLLFYLSIVTFAMFGYLRPAWLKIAMLAATVFLNLVLLLTFTRTQWLASAVAIVLCLLLFPKWAKASILPVVAIVGLAGAILFVANQTWLAQLGQDKNLLTPLVVRLETLSNLDQTASSNSAITRYLQVDASLESISNHPLTGVGLGNVYRDPTPREIQVRYTRFTRYIENSYLYLTTKLGLPGLALFVWLAIAILITAFRNYRTARDPLMRGLSLACMAAFVGLLIWGTTHPVFMVPEHTICVGLISGVCAALRNLDQ